MIHFPLRISFESNEKLLVLMCLMKWDIIVFVASQCMILDFGVLIHSLGIIYNVIKIIKFVSWLKWDLFWRSLFTSRMKRFLSAFEWYTITVPFTPMTVLFPILCRLICVWIFCRQLCHDVHMSMFFAWRVTYLPSFERFRILQSRGGRCSFLSILVLDLKLKKQSVDNFLSLPYSVFSVLWILTFLRPCFEQFSPLSFSLSFDHSWFSVKFELFCSP